MTGEQTALEFETRQTNENERRFLEWKELEGGRRLLQMAFAITAKYANRFQKTGRRVSIKLVVEELRYHLEHILNRRQQRQLKDMDGYAINNSYTAYIARHIMERRKDWAGLFETRKVKKSDNICN